MERHLRRHLLCDYRHHRLGAHLGSLKSAAAAARFIEESLPFILITLMKWKFYNFWRNHPSHRLDVVAKKKVIVHTYLQSLLH